jgi:hypothetical protein
MFWSLFQLTGITFRNLTPPSNVLIGIFSSTCKAFDERLNLPRSTPEDIQDTRSPFLRFPEKLTHNVLFAAALNLQPEIPTLELVTIIFRYISTKVRSVIFMAAPLP